jgi:hypothetical protein
MRILLSITLLALLLFSCNDDTSLAPATVEGHWELERALRNNTETGMLDGLYFDFKPDGRLVTNLMGNEDPGTYLWEGEEIITEGIKLPLTYQVQEITDSTLHLRSSYRGFQFDFMLAREKEMILE